MVILLKSCLYLVSAASNVVVMLATADCSNDAWEAEAGQAMPSASCKGALCTAALPRFNPGRQLSPTQLPVHSPLVRWGREPEG